MKPARRAAVFVYLLLCVVPAMAYSADPSGNLSPADAASSFSAVAPGALTPSQPAPVSGQVIDPSLVQDGPELKATGTALPVEVDSALPGAFSVKAGELVVRVRPTGSTQRKDPLIVGGDSAMYADSGPATDTAIRPTAYGVETFLQLRGQAAPQEFGWQVSMLPGQGLVQLDDNTIALVGAARPQSVPAPSPRPEGTPLSALLKRAKVPSPGSPAALDFVRRSRTVDTGRPPSPPRAPESPVELPPIDNAPEDAPIVSDQVADASRLQTAAQRGFTGRVLVLFRAGWSRDANGNDVPIRLSVDGDTITLTVKHRDNAGIAYPVVVDPQATAIAQRSIPLGAALNFAAFFQTDGVQYANTFTQNFDAMVDETGAKAYDPGLNYPDGYKGVWARPPALLPDNTVDWGTDFRYVESVIDWARSNGKLVTETPLVWDNGNAAQPGAGVPPWLVDVANRYPSGSAYRRAVVRFLLYAYVSNVVAHLRDKVGEWVAVNEAVSEVGTPTDGQAQLRNNFWYRELGPTYVSDVFAWARAADGDVRLYYNDFDGEYGNDKSNYILRMVTLLKALGSPIDGVGFQLHESARTGAFHSYSVLYNNLARYAANGFSVAFTEMDVAYNPQTNLATDDPVQLQNQRQAYINAAAACRDVPQCRRLMTWGVADKYTWRDNRAIPGFTHPLLFNRDYAKKLAYDLVDERLKGAPRG